MNNIQRQANDLYMRLTMGVFFDAYHDIMYDMVNQIEMHLEDGDVGEADEILKDLKAIIKAHDILADRKL